LQMLEAVGPASICTRPDQLSGGQRQRVAISAHSRRSRGRRTVRPRGIERMQELARSRGTAILLVTYDSRISTSPTHPPPRRRKSLHVHRCGDRQHAAHDAYGVEATPDLAAAVENLDEAGSRRCCPA
jgi:hypothetical protein